MSLTALRPEDLKAFRAHGHVLFWEVAYYGDVTKPRSVTVECTKCGCVLIELVNPDIERQEFKHVRQEQRTTKRKLRGKP